MQGTFQAQRDQVPGLQGPQSSGAWRSDTLPGASLDFALPLGISHGSTSGPLPGSVATGSAPPPFPTKVQVAANKCYLPWRGRKVGKLRHRTYARSPDLEDKVQGGEGRDQVIASFEPWSTRGLTSRSSIPQGQAGARLSSRQAGSRDGWPGLGTWRWALKVVLEALSRS